MPAGARKFWFVAAGTGGHIFPGLTVADELKKNDPTAEFLFFGTADRLEAKLVPQHGYSIRFLKAKQWKGRGLVSRVTALLTLGWGFFQVLREVSRGRPTCLISVGGYVSMPTALACVAARVPIFLLEPNIRAGLSNRFLSRWARLAFCTPGSDALQLFKCPVIDTGNPVRSDLSACELRADVKKVLVLGGSQGAIALCKASLLALKTLKQEGVSFHLTLQTGEKNFNQSKKLQIELGLENEATVVSFINEVSKFLCENDLVIARAGAMTLAELAIAGLPTVLIPFPHAADDHQRVNARLLQDGGAVRMVDEKEPHHEARLVDELRALCQGDDAFHKRSEMAGRFREWARPHAARELVKQLLSKLPAKV